MTDQPGALLATIRSRCQMVRFASLGAELVSAQLVKRGIDKAVARRAADLADGSLGVALRWIEDDVIGPAGELAQQLDGVFAGRPAADLPGWFKRSADAYAERQLKRDELGSKDQMTREGLNLYLRLAAEHVRRRMTALAAGGAGAAGGGAGNGAQLERACAVIDAVARAESYLDANVSIPLVFQQFGATLDRRAGG